MRKLFLILFLIFICNSGNAEEKTFIEDIHYAVLPNREFHSKEVTLVFSVYCKACFYNDAVFMRIKKDLPGDVNFKELHISNKGKFLMAPSKILFLSGDEKYTVLKNTMFDLVHKKEIKDYSAFLSEVLPLLKISENDFIKKDDDAVFMKEVDEKEKEGVVLARQYGIPVLVVNNKYAVNLRKLKNVGEIKSLVNYLLGLEK